MKNCWSHTPCEQSDGMECRINTRSPQHTCTHKHAVHIIRMHNSRSSQVSAVAATPYDVHVPTEMRRFADLHNAPSLPQFSGLVSTKLSSKLRRHRPFVRKRMCYKSADVRIVTVLKTIPLRSRSVLGIIRQMTLQVQPVKVDAQHNNATCGPR